MTNGWNPPPGGQGQPPQQGWGQPAQPAQPQQGWGQPGQAPQPQYGGAPAQAQFGAPAPQPGAPAAPGQTPSFPNPFPQGMPSASHASGMAKGFFASLLDFKFQAYITPKILGVLYGLIMLMAALGIPMVWYQALIRPLTDDYEFTEPEFLPALLAPIGALLYVIFGRVLLETVAVRFRNTEQLDELLAKTPKKD